MMPWASHVTLAHSTHALAFPPRPQMVPGQQQCGRPQGVAGCRGLLLQGPQQQQRQQPGGLLRGQHLGARHALGLTLGLTEDLPGWGLLGGCGGKASCSFVW